MATARAGKLRNIWGADDLPLKLKLRLYKSACCSILVYGSEAWRLDKKTCAIINGANAMMLSHITNRPRRDEACKRKHTTTFNIISWIRARRLRWLGHILRLHDADKQHSEQRLLFQAVKHIFEHPSEGDLLMDAPVDQWQELLKQAKDKGKWKKFVEATKQSKAPAVNTQQREEGPATRSQTAQIRAATAPTATAHTTTNSKCYTKHTRHMTDEQARDNYFAQQTKTRARPPVYANTDIRRYFLPTIYGVRTTMPTTTSSTSTQKTIPTVAQQPTTTEATDNSKPFTHKQRTAFARAHYIVHHGSAVDAFNFLQQEQNVRNTPIELISEMRAMFKSDVTPLEHSATPTSTTLSLTTWSPPPMNGHLQPTESTPTCTDNTICLTPQQPTKTVAPTTSDTSKNTSTTTVPYPNMIQNCNKENTSTTRTGMRTSRGTLVSIFSIPGIQL